jgi:hypothetical protein
MGNGFKVAGGIKVALSRDSVLDCLGGHNIVTGFFKEEKETGESTSKC